MAERKETVILEFEIDQTQAQQSLVQTEKNILALKKQQAELNKEYKAGKISEDEYVKSNIKLQQAVKKETDQKNVLNRLLQTESNSRNAMRQRVSDLNKEYNNLNLTTEKGIKRADELQKELAQLNAELNKGSKAAGQFKDNIGNYPQQLGEAAKGINVAGTSMGDLTNKISGFLKPGAAAVGIAGLLASAYARSATGSRDLAFAQAQLAIATGLLSESFASMISSSEDGEGAVTSFVNAVLDRYLPALSGISKAIALTEQQLKDLEISRAFAAGFAKDDERRAELARRIRDDEEESFEKRLEASKQIDALLERSGQRTVTIIKAQIQGVKDTTIGYENNRESQLKVAQLTAEIADKEEEITGKLTENVKARETIQKTINDLARAQRRQQTNVDNSTDNPLTNAFQNSLDIEEDATRRFNERVLKDQKEFENKRIRQANRSAEARIALEEKVNDARINAAIGILGSLSTLFDQQSEEYKAFATFQTLISTYSAAQKAYEAAFVPPTIASPAIAAFNVATAIATGLANVAAIHGIQFAEGGWTGPGEKMQAVGVVHADEYVTPKRVKNLPQAQPHLAALEQMRIRGYADGGLTVNSISQPINQQLDILNIVKHMPAPIVGIKQFAKEWNAVQVKQAISKR
jgi:hypothetical protein